MRSQENPDIFLEKGPFTASLQRPMRCYGALVAFYRVPTEFLLAILCALTTLSLRFHGAFTALTLHALRFHGVRTALSRHLHCADGMLKVQRHPKSIMYAKIRK